MFNYLKKTWAGYVQPIWRRPKGLQVAALCYKYTAEGRKVLLITSRDTGRWIIPKGWPIRGLEAQQTAMQEAWEEAGVLKGRWEEHPIGTYSYDKITDEGLPQPIETLVYPVAVDALVADFPESDERTRKWVTPQEAAKLVTEPELKAILQEF